MQQYPLSLPQKEIWTEWLAWSNTEHLNIGGYAELTGPIDKALLEQSLNLLAKENIALRLLPDINGSQVILPQVNYKLEYVDFSGELDPQHKLAQWQETKMAEPFSPHQPPVRFALLKASEDKHAIVIQAMHTVMDGWSLSITPKKWADCYNRLREGQLQSEDSKLDYIDYVEDSNQYYEGKSFIKDNEYWSATFSTLPEPVFTERYNVHAETGELSKAYINKEHIAGDIREQITAFSKHNKVSNFPIYLSLLAVYLCKTQGMKEVVIGVPNLNRWGNKYKNTLGMFVSVLPIAIEVKSGQSLADLVKDVSAKLKKSYRHAKYPLTEHAKRLEVIKSGRDRLFDVIFSYEEFEFTAFFGEAQFHETKQTFNPYSRYPLALSLCDFIDAKDTELVIESGSAYFSEAESQLLGARIVGLAKQLFVDEVEIDHIVPYTNAELELLKRFNDRTTAQQDHQSYAHTVLNNALISPKTVALLSAERSLTYQQLIVCAAHLADKLKAAHVTPGDNVMLALHRGPEVVVAMLACSFIGAVFLPIDLDWPDARIADITEQAGCTIALTNANSNRVLSNESMVVCITSLLENPYPLTELTQYTQLNHQQAYVLFTSGSTGKPKGVAVSHQALKNRLNWIVENWSVSSSDRSLQATQINFDPALIELLVPLMAGGSVAFPEPGRLLPEWLPQLLEDFSATMLAFVPSTLTRFLDGIDPTKPCKLRVCCTGGEALSYELAETFYKKTNAQLYNVYGPTEATIFCSAWLVPNQSSPSHKYMPIGKPIANTQALVLSESNHIQPFGVLGEIVIAGQSLAAGYLNNEKETAEKFVPLSLPGFELQDWYKTGDLGWLDCDGVLHFAGRKDRQIKLRGYRIELTEIENAMASIKGVDAAACQLVKEKGGAIHAWFSSKQSISDMAVRSKLATLLPDYMVPQKIQKLTHLPTTANGKVDYQKLHIDDHEHEEVIARAPIGKLEKSILNIWKQTLNNKDITVVSHFFEAGGDSLAAVVVLNEIEHLVGRKLSLQQLVAHPTVASLSESINAQLERPNLLISLGDTTRNTSLYVAASGNGDLIRFKSLANCMKGVSDLHMLQPPGHADDISIHDLAQLYVEKIKERNDKSLYLAGFSVGGIVAVETARQLKALGIQVKTVFVVDTILLKMPRIVTFLWRQLAQLASRWHIARQRHSGSPLLSALQDKGLLKQVEAMQKHKLAQYDDDAVLIKSSAYRWIHGLLLNGWRKVLTGNLREVEISTSHSRFFEPGKVDQLANIIKQDINKKDGA